MPLSKEEKNTLTILPNKTKEMEDKYRCAKSALSKV